MFCRVPHSSYCCARLPGGGRYVSHLLGGRGGGWLTAGGHGGRVGRRWAVRQPPSGWAPRWLAHRSEQARRRCRRASRSRRGRAGGRCWRFELGFARGAPAGPLARGGGSAGAGSSAARSKSEPPEPRSGSGGFGGGRRAPQQRAPPTRWRRTARPACPAVGAVEVEEGTTRPMSGWGLVAAPSSGRGRRRRGPRPASRPARRQRGRRASRLRLLRGPGRARGVGGVSATDFAAGVVGGRVVEVEERRAARGLGGGADVLGRGDGVLGVGDVTGLGLGLGGDVGVGRRGGIGRGAAGSGAGRTSTRWRPWWPTRP